MLSVRDDRGAARLRLRPSAGVQHHRLAALGPVRPAEHLVFAAAPFEHVVADPAVEPVGAGVAEDRVGRRGADHVLEPGQRVLAVAFRRAGGEVDGDRLRRRRRRRRCPAPRARRRACRAEVAADDVVVAGPAARRCRCRGRRSPMSRAFAAVEVVVARARLRGSRLPAPPSIGSLPCPPKRRSFAAAAVDRLVAARPAVERSRRRRRRTASRALCRRSGSRCLRPRRGDRRPWRRRGSRCRRRRRAGRSRCRRSGGRRPLRRTASRSRGRRGSCRCPGPPQIVSLPFGPPVIVSLPPPP